MDNPFLNSLQLPFLLIDGQGNLLQASPENLLMEQRQELLPQLASVAPGETVAGPDGHLLVVPVKGNTNQRICLQIPLDQREVVRGLKREVDEFDDKLAEMYFLQEMLENRGAELNQAHQQLMEKNQRMKVLKEQLEDRQAQVERDFSVAKKIVEELFPHPYYSHEGVNIFARTVIANNLGGDFYDMISQQDGSITSVLADVSGHGLPSAMILLMARILLSTFSSKTEGPAELLQSVHRELYDNIPPSNYIAIAAVRLDVQSRKLQYSIGGLYNGILLRPGSENLHYLNTNNFALAFIRTTHYRYDEFQLEVGDKLVFYTDGITEAVNIDNEVFGNQRVEQLVRENCHLTGHGLVSLLFQEQKQFAGYMNIEDDTSVMVIEVPVEPVFTDVVEMSGRQLDRQFRDWVNRIDWHTSDSRVAGHMEKVLYQALKNSLQSCEAAELSPRVLVRVYRRYRQIRIQVTDAGEGFRGDQHLFDKLEELGSWRRAGQGFKLYQTVLDEVFTNAEGNEFNLVKYLGRDDEYQHTR